MTLMMWAVGILAAGAAIWLASFLADGLRQPPEAPAKLSWAPDAQLGYADARGMKLRYATFGSGPPLVLLHTLRTQLDLFENLLPLLREHFTIYALDLPGHGYSDIPNGRYDAPFFCDAIEALLEDLDLNGVALAGVSIGGSIALILGARSNPRIDRVISINPYDYANGRGMGRSSPFGWVAANIAPLPVIGETIMRFRPFFIIRAVLRGGVANPTNISPALMMEMYRVGDRRGHYRAFLRLLRHAKSWSDAKQDYRHIKAPTLLIWGGKDWSKPYERERTRALIPNAQMETIAGGGHFLPLDRPQELQRLIVDFAAARDF